MKVIKKVRYFLFYILLWPLALLEDFWDRTMHDENKILISEVKSFFSSWVWPSILTFALITTAHFLDRLTWALVFILGYLPSLIFQLVYYFLPDPGERSSLIILSIRDFLFASGIVVMTLGLVYLPVP